MQVHTLLQTDNHTSTPPLSFLQAGCPSCRPTNTVKALNANQSTKGTQLISSKKSKQLPKQEEVIKLSQKCLHYFDTVKKSIWPVKIE